MVPPEASAPMRAAPPVTGSGAGATAASTAATAAEHHQQRPPRHRRVQFIRIENANGDAAEPTPTPAVGSGSGSTPLAAAASPAEGFNKAGAPWGARPPVHPHAAGCGAGTPRMAGSTPRGGGGGGSLPGTPRSCAGTPRCRHAVMAAPPPPPPAKAVAAQDHKYFKVILWASFMLTINAGFINTITLNNLHAMPSAHVTGMVARASNFAAEGQGWLCAQYVVAYSCFLVGACISGMLINYETFYLGRSYGRALFIIAAVQSVALLTENVYDDSIWFIWLCCFCCGLQNGLTSKYSGNAVRTTHLTGATTDLGIAIGHILKGRKGEWWKVQLHGIALVGFFIGGVLGVHAFRHYEHAALLFNVGLTAALALAHTCYVSYHERMSVLAVLESKSDIRLHKKRVPRPAEDPSKSPAHGSRPTTPSLLTRFGSGGNGSFRGALPSPAAIAQGLLLQHSHPRRHFPKNNADTDTAEANAAAAAAAAEGKQALLSAAAAPPLASASSSTGDEADDNEGEEEAKDVVPTDLLEDMEMGGGGGGSRGPPGFQAAAAMAPSPSSRFNGLIPSFLARVGLSPRAGRGGGGSLRRQQSLPMLRAEQQQQAVQAVAVVQQQQQQYGGGRGHWHGHGTHARVLPHHHSLPVSRAGAPVYYHDEQFHHPGAGFNSCCSTPRTLKDWCEDAGLVPMPEDVGETGLYAQGEEPMVSMMSSPGCDAEAESAEEGLELDWYGGCSGCNWEGGVSADGTPVEGEFGWSPRCGFAGDGKAEEGEDDDDPPTDDEIDGLDIEQGGAGGLITTASTKTVAAAAAAPAPAAALQKPPLPPRAVTHPAGGPGAGSGGGGKRRPPGAGGGRPPLKRGTSL